MKTFNVDDFEYDPSTKTLTYRGLLLMVPMGSFLITGKTCTKLFVHRYKTYTDHHVYTEPDTSDSFKVVLRFM